MPASLASSSLTQSSFQVYIRYKKRAPGNMEAVQSWVSNHKLTSIGGIWATTIGASLAYTRKMTLLKPSLRLIHARMHAQAITLAVLSGAAAYHYYEKSADKLEQNPDKTAKIHHPVP